MSIVLISRGSYSRGKGLAEKVAQTLGYECISREVLMSAAKEFGVKELKLVKAMRDAPSFWGMFPGTRQKYIAYVQAALTRYLVKDNVVYHGLAGHLLVHGVSHVLKVRVISNLEDRVRLVMENEHLSEKESRKFIHKADEQRQKWTKLVYGVDNSDPDLYDLVINVAQIEMEKAVGIVTDTVNDRKFQAMTYSIQSMKNLALSCEVRAGLIELDQDIQVHADGGSVSVHAKAAIREKKKKNDTIRERALKIPGVETVEVEVVEDLYKRILGTMRLR